MSPRAQSTFLGVGLVAVVLAALPFKLFELDRYFVPKELVLHVVALVLFVGLLMRARTVMVDNADKLLAAFVAWSVVSALFTTNYWLAQRALGVTVSSAVVFWAARRLGAAGSYRPILVAASIATVCAAAAGLAQAYGLEADYFSLNRAPGGTFGNRNFVAHVCAIGLPALVYMTVTARTPMAAFAGTVGCAAVAALVLLSRSRAAWLAVAACAVVLLVALFASRAHWRGRRVGPRLGRLALTSAVAGAAVTFLPNSLNWNSDSPYLDSALRMADYSSGSGRGRVAQYLNSARMALDDPVLGVGPGNWPVRYSRFAPQHDASLAGDGMTANPWPSSDWVAFVSERGTVASIALMAMLALLFASAFRRWGELADGDAVLAKVAAIGTIAATAVVSAFDAVLLLAAPALLAWSVIGATSGAGRGGREMTFARAPWRLGVAAVGLVLTMSVARSASQIVAITTVGAGGSRAGWIAAAPWDPGSYRINLRVAEIYAARGSCGSSGFYARRALGLFPNASAPRRVLRRCR